MLARYGQAVECGEASGIAARLRIQFRADPADEFCRAAFRREHAAEKQQIAGLNGFRVGTERLRRCRELDAKFF